LVASRQAREVRTAPRVSVRLSFFILPIVCLLGLIPTALAQTSQTITFNALGAKTFGAVPFTVSATASSGLVVSFASLTTPVCTVSATTVTILTAGTCTIQASQAGNATYAPAPNVNQSFTVAKAAQTITFAALGGKTYGAAPFAVSATASSGLTVAFISTTTAVCTVSVATVTIVTGGTCTIQAQQAGNGNYNAATNVNQSFTVAKAAQTVTFAALAGKTFGAAPFTVSATASSGLAVTFTSTTTTICTVSTATVTIVTGGTCTIRAAQAGNTSYLAATNVDQSFTVAKASQTITFAALAGKTFGAAPFTVSGTASSGLAVTFTSTTTTICTVSAGTVTLVTGGTCTIRAAQAGNTSYLAATNVDQSFTVAKASQTVTFAALAGQTYGVAPFTVSATASSGLAVAFSSLTTTVCTVSGATVTIRTAGTCTIRAAQAGNTSYLAAANVDQGFVVAKASQTITFGALANKTLGAAPFAVSATASSALAVTFSSLTTSVCTVSGSTVTLVAGGTCTVQAAQAGNGNYNAAPSVPQTFTVAAANQSITFGPIAEQVAGTPAPPLGATASSGLAVQFSSLTPSVCTVSGSAMTLLAAGTCTVQASQPGNASYNAAPNVNQNFIVISGIQFGTRATFATGTYPMYSAVADINGDNKLDLLVSNLNSGTVSTFTGDGNTNFTPLATLSTGGVYPWRLQLADINGDGILDLVVANTFNNTVAFLRGTGNGGFAAPTTISFFGAPYGLAIADVNGDGKLDLIATDGDDAQGNGQSIEVLLGNGDGTFQTSTVYWLGTGPYAIAIGDFDGDGRPDLAVVNTDTNNLSVLRNLGGGTFSAATNYVAGQYPLEIAAGDVNGDGKLDLVVTNQDSWTVSVFLGNGDGTFAAKADTHVGVYPQGLVLADLNGDGRLDVAVSNSYDNTLSVLLGGGDGTFHPAINFVTGTTPVGLSVADVNQDGKPDLIVSNGGDNTVTVLFNSSMFVPVGSISIQSGSPQSAAINTAYAAPFTVLVRDGNNNLLPGAQVTFSAPSTGPSGTFSGGIRAAVISSNASGVAIAPTFTANGLGGTFTVTASAGTHSAAFALNNTGGGSQAPSFTSAAAPNGTIGIGYSYTLTANGSPAPTFSALPSALPTGLALNGTSGLLNGTPTATGTFAGMFTATNGISPNASQSFAITIAGTPQTISFGSLGGKTFGDAPFTVGATASSGLPVSFTSLITALCTVSGSTVTIVGAGTCTIRASQAGNTNFAAAPNVDQNLVVAKLNQTITFNALPNHLPGDPPFVVTASATSNIAVVFTSLTLPVCTVSGNTVTLLTAGTCTIQAAQSGNSNYNAAPNVPRSFTIAADQPPAVTIVAPVNNSAYVAPATIPLYATASDPDGTVSKVEFYSASTLIGTATTAPYSFVWGNVATGSYVVTAKAYDNQTGITTSSAVNLTVAATGTPLTFAQHIDSYTYNFSGGIRTPVGLATGDFTGDGKPDLVVSSDESTVSNVILPGLGNGTFGVNPVGIGGDADMSIAVADFNGDGKLDLAYGSGVVQVQLGNGNGTMQPVTTLPGVTNSRAVVAADVNGDGKMDLIAARDDGNVTVFLGVGNGTFQTGVNFLAGTWLEGVAVADFNNDGKLDLVVTSSADNAVSILLGNGNGTFQAPIHFPVTGPFKVVTGDFNGDGKIDIAVGHIFAPTVTVLIGNGNGTFQPGADFPAGGNNWSLVVADFNADGKLDLAVTNQNNNTVSILAGNGNGTFRAPVTFAVGQYPRGLIVADLNSDGTLDLVSINYNDSTVSALLNTRGLTTQAPTMTSGLPPDGVGSAPYSFTFTATGVPAPTFSLTNASFTAGTGMLLGSNGVLAASVASSGTYTGTVVARNGVNPDASQNFVFVVPRVTNTIDFPQPGDTVLVPCGLCVYSDFLVSSSIPVAPTVKSLTPAVCTISTTEIGLQTGVTVTPVEVGTCTLRAEVYGAIPVDRSFHIFAASPPPVQLTSPVDGAGFVAPATIPLTATVAPSPPTATITKVDFLKDGVVVGTATTPPYTLNWTNVAVGTYAVTASAFEHYVDHGGDVYPVISSLPVTLVVTASADQPAVSLTAPAPNVTYFLPATISLVASATNPSGTIAKVDFYNGAFLLATKTTPPYTFDWNVVQSGLYTVTAKATSANGVVATSAPLAILVDPGMPIPLAHYTFDDNWNVSGLVKEPYGFLGEPRGSVAPVAAPAAAPKADTCNAASFSGGTIEVSGLSVAPQAAAKTTVAFWMRWNGVDGAMPLSWATQGLLFSGGGFGFTTLNGDVFGVSSTGLANTWHYVVAEFTKGGVASNRLSIDKIPQALTQRAGTPILANAVVSGALRFGGQYGTTTNRFGGLIDEVWLFNSVLSPAYVNALYASASPCAPVSAIIVLPGSNAVYEAPATIDVVVLATSQNSVITQFDYYDGGVFIGTRQPGFGFSLANLPAGTHTFTVKATDATGAFATSSPVTATVAALAGTSTVAVVTPAQGGTFYTSGTVHFGATAIPAPSYAIALVEFYANGQKIGWTTTAPYDFTWTYPTAGTYTITAHVTDNAGLVTISAPITITVVAGAPAVTYYYNDVAGTPIAATDQSGNLLWEETYAPYGDRYSHEDTGTQNGIWYAGKPFEDSTGLAYLGARWYSASTGRFYSTDPQRFRDDSVNSFNRYAYANNNPYRFIDPDGKSPAVAYYLEMGAWLGIGALSAGGTNALLQVLDHGKVDNWTGLGGVFDAAAEGAPFGLFGIAIARMDAAASAQLAAPTISRSAMAPKLGSSGAPGAGKRFSTSVAASARDESEYCVFCGVKTTREPGPTQSQIDHAIPKSRDGNNTLANAQNTCRSCNNEKRARTTQEYLDSKTMSRGDD